MILHSDGRIEGTPSEIAEYKIKLIERAERAVEKYFPKVDVKASGIVATEKANRKYPGAGTTYISAEDFNKFKPL